MEVSLFAACRLQSLSMCRLHCQESFILLAGSREHCSTAARQNSELDQEEQGGEVSQNISGFDSVNAIFGVLHESGFANLMKAKASEERRRRMSDDVC